LAVGADAEHLTMTKSRYRVGPPSQGRFLVSFCLLVSAALIFYLVFSGQTYAMTNGSGVGLIATMIVTFLALLMAFAGVVALVMGMVRRHEQAMIYAPERMIERDSRRRDRDRHAA
jgi:hypothetical protein